ncbi:MAG: hypothetical protein K6A34_07315 [Methanobrevibacter sp.]|nr:hypothetical protein [Methanobrevibacter sp.]
MINKNSIEKFEEFFATLHKDDIFEVLETYPENNSIIVNYNELELFDPDLADLLIVKPEVTIEAAQLAVKNIDPLSKDADLNVKFENVTNIIPFERLNSKYVGSLVVLEDVVIVDVEKPKPIISVATFECRGCLRLCEVEQNSVGHILEPSLCGECGGRSFTLLQNESKFKERQILTVGVEGTSKKLTLCLYNDDCSHDKYYVGNHLSITGVLKTFKTDGFEYYFDCNNVVQLTSDENIYELDSSDRNSPEYKIWQKTIIDNDQVCACCGGHKHLHAHHIFGYKNNPSYRLNIENGIALCKWCHGKYHSYYGKDANPKTLIKFIKRFGGGR